MKKLLAFILVPFIMLALAGCRDELEAPALVETTPPTNAEPTAEPPAEPPALPSPPEPDPPEYDPTDHPPYQVKDIRLVIDGETFPSTAIIKNGATLLPVDEIVPHTGGAVVLGDESDLAIITEGYTQIVVYIGETLANVNGVNVQLDAPVMDLDGKTMAPLQLFIDYLDIGVGATDSSFYFSTNPAEKIPVLVYHHFLPEDEIWRHPRNPYIVTNENFDRQMEYLHDNGFYTLTISDMDDFLFNGRRLPERSVKIHFDDGYYSNFLYAYPILKSHGLRATVFMITHLIEDLGHYQPPIDYSGTTFTAAKTILGTEDVFETASHTHDMHRLAEGSNETVLVRETKENIISDTLKSFEFVGNHTSFAYPHTMYNDTVIEALKEAGITTAYIGSNDYVTVDSDPFLLRRFSIEQHTRFIRFQNIVHREM